MTDSGTSPASPKLPRAAVNKEKIPVGTENKLRVLTSSGSQQNNTRSQSDTA